MKRPRLSAPLDYWIATAAIAVIILGALLSAAAAQVMS